MLSLVPAVPISFAPTDGEAGVLSVLAVQADQGWSAAAGSLLCVPSEVAEAGWQAWAKGQPSTGRPPSRISAFQLGPNFDEEPFPASGLCAL
jgi:hypothetical protein